jgi:hypothetical protein
MDIWLSRRTASATSTSGSRTTFEVSKFKEDRVRLEPFCTMRMRYTESSWHQLFSDGGEWLGYGQGDGTVTGELEGQVAWSNYPRRREDGVWMPNLRGCIKVAPGRDVLVSVHGQSIAEQGDEPRRAILGRVELATEDAAYRWLNTSFLVGEGEIDEQREHWWIATFVCVNEVAQAGPAIGEPPPTRFRQPGMGRRHPL